MVKQTKLDIKKLWLKAHLERLEWQKEQELAHQWAMLALKVGTIILLTLFLLKSLL